PSPCARSRRASWAERGRPRASHPPRRPSGPLRPTAWGRRMARALARRGADEERALALGAAGPRRGARAALTRALGRRYGDRITGSLTLPGREGAYAPIPDDVPPALRKALHARGIERLYSHQADAWHAAARGEHLAIATPTASGKSLCYTL